MNRDDQLADLLVAWDDAIATGRPVTPQDHCRDHPNLLQPFLDLLKAVGHIDRVFDSPPTDPQQFVEQINAGRYKPRTFHAAGGLGVVAVAEDQELKRPVALKVMQQLAALDPVARRRFLLEAEITGKLEHPGVAPVYGAGEDPDGLPYYAMRFIQGKTLADHIREHHATTDPAARRLDFARLLRCFASVCQTVAYAHARGVLHRDIKPGNVMLGPYGETLLVDWGLAKQFDLPDPTGSVPIGFKPVDLKPTGETIGGGQTVAGQVKGSPAFMAPEQARGEWDRVGPAADIYALGATLYVLLTGELPYTGDSTEQVIRAVKAGPPRPVLTANSSTPKPLAAVCAKAMARTPNERYASAQELAADVERWLADEPVSAYRDPMFTRARRWVKRHRTLTAAAAAAVLVLTAALAIVAPILTAKNQELGKLNGDLSQANTDLNKANTDLTDANDKLTESNTKLTDAHTAAQVEFREWQQTLRKVMSIALVFHHTADERTNQLRKATITHYCDHLRQFAERNQHKPEMWADVAEAWLAVAELEYILGRPISSLEAATAATDGFASVRTKRPDDREVLFGWGCAVHLRGEVLTVQGQIAEGRKLLTDAAGVYERLAADPTPIMLAERKSFKGIMVESPAYRLAHVTLLTSGVQLRAEITARRSDPVAVKAIVATYRDRLREAERLLTGGKPLSDETPMLTRVRVYQLLLRLAELEPTRAAEQLVTKLLTEVATMADRYPAVTEYTTLAMNMLFSLAQAERERARATAPLVRPTVRAQPVAAAILYLSSVYDHREWVKKMVVVEKAADRLTVADLGLDLEGDRANAIVTKLEMAFIFGQQSAEMGDPEGIKFTITEALRALERMTKLSQLPPDAAFRAITVGSQLSLMAGPYTLKYAAEFEKAFGFTAKLLERLREEAPDDPDLIRSQVVILSAQLAVQAADGKPVGDQLDRVEKMLAALPAAPNDPWGYYAKAVVVNARGLEAALVRHDMAAAIPLLEQVLERLDQAEEKGMPGAAIDNFRPWVEYTLANGYLIRANELLKGPPAWRDEARQLAERGIKLLRERQKKGAREHPDIPKGNRLSAERLAATLKTLEEAAMRAKGK